ncbi:unnamed protein product [Moneuplotes crassus]|uniref:Uncharacterized protein n=1 Tax=Euplotes crassus TaxID=5936 RepID=A0AAD1U334_EUPCR|nr:unnamed protein product [Moneuplotes crassus]
MIKIKDEELEKIFQKHTESVSIINAFGQELEKSEQEKKNLQADYDNMKKELTFCRSSYFILVYKITTGEDKQIGPVDEVTFRLSEYKYRDFLKSLKNRIPDIEILNLNDAYSNNKEAKTFMTTHFPNKVGVFNFNKGSSLKCCLSVFFEELVEISQRVIGELNIHEFEISQAQLIALLCANKHKQLFGLIKCKLDLSSVPDFGGNLSGSWIKGLDLDGCGEIWCCNWQYNGTHFENLIAGLSQEEDFKKNLKMIKMSECGMEKNMVEKILEDYGFGHVEIYNHSK